MKKRISIALILCLIFAMTALAADGPVMREAYGTAAGNSPTAAIVVSDEGVVQNPDFAGELTIRGSVTAAQASGIYIKGSDLDNGLVIQKASGEYAIGGRDILFDADGDWLLDYNSVIILDGSGEDPDVEGKYTTGILVDAGEGSNLITVDRTYIKTSGYRAPTIISLQSDSSVVFRNSYLYSAGAEKSFMPNFKLLAGSARTTCLMSDNTWFYNTTILARDWGAVSLDTTPSARINMINSYGEAYSGGYGLYAVNGTTTRMFGSKLVGSQYGMFLMGNGVVNMDNIEAADEEALLYQDYVNFEQPVIKDGSSAAVGLFNAAVVHVNSGVGQAGLINPATLTVKNSTLSTMEEDVVSSLGNDMSFLDYEDYLLNPIKDAGASWFYLEYSKGSLVFARSAGVNITYGEGAVLKPSNGVIVHSGIGYDSDAGNIYNDSSLNLADKISPITVNLEQPITGDIVHDDYQRYMYVNINSDYQGAITSGTLKSWNELWSDESLSAMLEAGGYSEAQFSIAENGDTIRSNLIRETGDYPATYGAVVKLADNVKWTVSDSCSMSSLTIGQGASIEAPVGYNIYVNCNSEYDYLTGTKLDALEPGVEYKMVAIAFPTGYNDVHRTDASFASVMKATELGLMNGLGDGSFRPNAYVTRAQAIKLAVCVHQLITAQTITPLAPEAGEPWYVPYVDYALANGLIQAAFSDYSAPVTLNEAGLILGSGLSGTGNLRRYQAAEALITLLGQ